MRAVAAGLSPARDDPRTPTWIIRETPRVARRLVDETPGVRCARLLSQGALASRLLIDRAMSKLAILLALVACSRTHLDERKLEAAVQRVYGLDVRIERPWSAGELHRCSGVQRDTGEKLSIEVVLHPGNEELRIFGDRGFYVSVDELTALVHDHRPKATLDCRGGKSIVLRGDRSVWCRVRSPGGPELLARFCDHGLRMAFVLYYSPVARHNTVMYR